MTQEEPEIPVHRDKRIARSRKVPKLCDGHHFWESVVIIQKLVTLGVCSMDFY